MKIEKRIGARVREMREAKRWSQEALGEQMTRYLGRPWSAQTVSVAENGDRDFRAEDMLALALVLGRPVNWFYQPNLATTERVQFESGFWVSEASMRRVYGLSNKEAYRIALGARKLADEIELLGEGKQS